MRMSRATHRRTRQRTAPRLNRQLRSGVAAAATLAVAAGCGGSGNANPSAPALQRLAQASLVPGGAVVSRPLPPGWIITMEVRFSTRLSTLRVDLGSSDVLVFDGSNIWHRVVLTRHGLVVDGRHTGSSTLRASRVSLRAQHGEVEIRGLVIRRSGR